MTHGTVILRAAFHSSHTMCPYSAGNRMYACFLYVRRRFATDLHL